MTLAIGAALLRGGKSAVQTQARGAIRGRGEEGGQKLGQGRIKTGLAAQGEIEIEETAADRCVEEDSAVAVDAELSAAGGQGGQAQIFPFAAPLEADAAKEQGLFSAEQSFDTRLSTVQGKEQGVVRCRRPGSAEISPTALGNENSATLAGEGATPGNSFPLQGQGSRALHDPSDSPAEENCIVGQRRFTEEETRPGWRQREPLHLHADTLFGSAADGDLFRRQTEGKGGFKGFDREAQAVFRPFRFQAGAQALRRKEEGKTTKESHESDEDARRRQGPRRSPQDIHHDALTKEETTRVTSRRAGSSKRGRILTLSLCKALLALSMACRSCTNCSSRTFSSDISTFS